MQLHRANIWAAFFFTFILVFFGLCGKPVAQAHQPKGEIRVVENSRPDINVLGHNVLQYLFEYGLDRNELVPCLGLSRKWIDDTTLEIELRQGVRFQNGELFDASAVKFNFDYQRQNNSGRGVQVYMENVREFKVVGPYTIQMKLKEPDSLILDILVCGPVAGWVIGAPQYMKEVGWEEFLKRPIGTGPFMIAEEVKDYRKVPEGEVYATLIAYPNYWNQGFPKIRRITFVQYSPKEALNKLLQGRVDLVTSLIPKDTLKVAENPHSMVVKGERDVTYTQTALNLMSPDTFPLRDLRVRKALNYAVNKKELIRYAFKGKGSLKNNLYNYV